jgi:hypothetical protein
MLQSATTFLFMTYVGLDYWEKCIKYDAMKNHAIIKALDKLINQM